MRTPLEEHQRLCALASEQALPALPYRPVVGECCGRGCDPCVWDYYERALARWRERVGESREDVAVA
jgi:hypothetical protein